VSYVARREQVPAEGSGAQSQPPEPSGAFGTRTRRQKDGLNRSGDSEGCFLCVSPVWLTHAVGDNTPFRTPLTGVGGRFEQASLIDPVEPCQGGIIDRMSRVPKKYRPPLPL
jgi:hypothetical protein